MFRILCGPAGEVASGVERRRELHPDLRLPIKAQCAFAGKLSVAATAHREDLIAQPPAAPRHIGAYRLLQCIGEGGFGEVWAAEQRAPVRRQVAVKLIKLHDPSSIERVLRAMGLPTAAPALAASAVAAGAGGLALVGR